jgi:sodium/bile acid cotransporter 7
LVLGYIGLAADIDVGDVFYKLAIRIVLPLILGQILRRCVPWTARFYTDHKKAFTRFQQYILVFLVYTVFCSTFTKDNDIPFAYIATMIAAVFCCLIGLMIGAWYTLGLLFKDRPDLRVMGLFGCTQKTVALGIPMIKALYENDPSIGLVTLPLLIWHPMQLIVGSYLSPKLLAWSVAEEKRLGINQDQHDSEQQDEHDMAENGAVAPELSDGPSTVPPSAGVTGAGTDADDADDSKTTKSSALTQQSTSISDDAVEVEEV